MMSFFVATGDSLADTDSALMKASQKETAGFVDDLRAIVNIDSGTGYAPGLAQVEAFLVRHLKKLGAQVSTIEAKAKPDVCVESKPSVGRTVVGTLHGNGSLNIMLMIHYDTVFEPGEAAKRPFRVEESKAFGPGVADAKGGALLILHALDIARRRGFKEYHTLTVLFNPDEEKSSLGSREIIKDLASRQDVVLIYEPPKAEEQVTIATNGIAWVHLDVQGAGAHAGLNPEKGRNALVELAHQITQLKDLGNSSIGTTVNWTFLETDNKERVNKIPGQACAIADMRLADSNEIERVQQDATRISQQKLIPDTQVSVTVESRRTPFKKNPDTDRLASLAAKIFSELGKKIEPVAMRYSTDASFAFNPVGGKPAVLDGMGIVGDEIHTPGEWADLNSIPSRLYLTVRMLEILAK